MATRLIEFKLQNGGSIWVEEEMPPDRGGLVAQYRSARNSAWLRQRMRRVFALEQHVAGVARSRERGLPHQGHGLHPSLSHRWDRGTIPRGSSPSGFGRASFGVTHRVKDLVRFAVVLFLACAAGVVQA